MNVIVLGAGKMGIRHVQGILTVDFIQKITVVDIVSTALDQAKENLKDTNGYNKCEFTLLKDLTQEEFNIGIIASTANNRLELFEMLVSFGCKDIMVEKPLGQTFKEVLKFNNKVEDSKVNVCVNHGRRIFDCYKRLKNDFKEIPQLQGIKHISMNTGAIGIGANGIHYLDILYFLLDADNAIVKAANIDDQIIESPRGANFCDFGGWAVIDYYKQSEVQATVMFSITSRSTVFGSWEFVAPHGRIYLNEVERKRINVYRKEESNLPMYRYFGDYDPPVESTFEIPFLGDVTAKWIVGLRSEEQLLPTFSESVKVHRLMFDWLNHSTTHKETFPIT